MPKMTPKDSESTQCLLDRSLVNADTLPLMKDVGLSIFASACSKNRGAFVLHPPDGHTYGCLAFPKDILDKLNIPLEDWQINPNTSVPIFSVDTVEDILKHHKDGNLTAVDTVKLLDFIVENAYQSTPDVSQEPYACDVSGLVTLKCGASSEKKFPIRAVTLAGVFTPALWATGGLELTLDEASTFYTPDDFDEMKKMGLNTVQIPVPLKMFSDTHSGALDWQDLLSEILRMARKAGLDAILVLDESRSNPADVPQLVRDAAAFASDYNGKYSDNIIVALVLPALDTAMLEAATITSPGLEIWIPAKGGDFKDLHSYPMASGASLDFSHTKSVEQIASSTSQEDRAKLFYHENMACIARAPLEYSACYQDIDVMVADGFDLAIDDCHLKGIAQNWQDYGQCERFNETIGSNWWKDHRYSFAARQLYAYEQGRGWSFAAWKLWGTDPESLGVLDTPAKLLALQEVDAAGLMPSLFDMDIPITYPLKKHASSPVGLACLNPPENDFAMGDATFAPTPAPPPNCGNGWWNFTTSKCDYWIPPPPPTPAPTKACPVCPNASDLCASYMDDVNSPTIPDASMLPEVPAADGGLPTKAFFSGAGVAVVIYFILNKIVGGRRREGYESV